ncbi:MAG: MATE family efflux transporter [Alphaproteobacteria bacterium]|nr:MATE family efflux transporter [Alphaproteobacteria bacterium]
MTQASPLLAGDVRRVLREQSVPMAVGVVFMLLVSLIDTYWASRLGPDPLAAMSFSFPVIGVVLNVALGLMVGTSVVVARSLGAGHREDADRLSTHALLLGLGVVAFVSVLGVLSIRPLFSALGAQADLLPVIEGYMFIWYASAAVLVVPMMVNGVLRAHGDARTPRDTMILIAFVNGLLDPLFIFGWGPIPAMGLEGAAVATAIARLVGGLAAAFALVRAKALDLHLPSPAELLRSWSRILKVGVPVTITNVLGPIATAMFTAIVAAQGQDAVAGYGIGARIEALVLIAPIALSSGLSPFVGQNWGAHLKDRVSEGVRISVRFCIAWGLGALVLLLFTAPLIAQAFTDKPDIQEAVVLYLRVVPLGYASYGVMMTVNSTFNAMDHATRATWLSVLRSILIAVPVAWVGGQLLGLTGVYIGLVVGSLASSLLGLRWMRALLDPKAELESERVKLVEDGGRFLLDNTAPEERASMAALIETISALEDVSLRRVRWDAVGFFVKDRQLGHIHPSGHIDLPLPMELGEALVSRDLLEFHRLHPDNGWFSYPLDQAGQLAHAEWLLRLAHALYELRKRGADAELAQDELDSLSLCPRSRAGVLTAVARWGVKIAS